MKTVHSFALGSALLAIAIPAIRAQEEATPPPHPAQTSSAELKKLIAVIRPVANSNVRGSVEFEKVDDGILVTAKVGGLTQNANHAIHIHEFGDLGSDDATSAGDHFNPAGHPHAVPDDSNRHAGDLGNLQADGDGNAVLTLVVNNVTLDSGKRGILGRAVIVHAKADDGGQPSGNAGDRIGAGVIGISKDSKPKIEPAPKIQPPSAPPPETTSDPEKKETRPTTPDSDESPGE